MITLSLNFSEDYFRKNITQACLKLNGSIVLPFLLYLLYEI